MLGIGRLICSENQSSGFHPHLYMTQHYIKKRKHTSQQHWQIYLSIKLISAFQTWILRYSDNIYVFYFSPFREGRRSPSSSTHACRGAETGKNKYAYLSKPCKYNATRKSTPTRHKLTEGCVCYVLHSVSVTSLVGCLFNPGDLALPSSTATATTLTATDFSHMW